MKEFKTIEEFKAAYPELIDKLYESLTKEAFDTIDNRIAESLEAARAEALAEAKKLIFPEQIQRHKMIIAELAKMGIHSDRLEALVSGWIEEYEADTGESLSEDETDDENGDDEKSEGDE